MSSTVITAELAAGCAAKHTPRLRPRRRCRPRRQRGAGAVLSRDTAAILPEAGPALAATLLAFVGTAFVLRYFDREEGKGDSAQSVKSPLNLVSVAQFALFLGTVIIAGRIIADAFGQAGLLPFAATAGLADVDAVTLAAGSLVRGGLDAGAGSHAVLVAVLMNTLAKGGIAVVTGGWKYAGYYFAAAFGAGAVGALVWWLATPLLAPIFG